LVNIFQEIIFYSKKLTDLFLKQLNVLWSFIVVSSLWLFDLQGLPFCCGILDATLAALPDWRRVLNAFPVVTWFGFMEYIRTRVNALATEDHLRELVNQLQVMGEVFANTLRTSRTVRPIALALCGKQLSLYPMKNN
jgi:hypothetical protein